MKFITTFTKTALAITLISAMSSGNSIASDGKIKCPAEFTAPEDLTAPLSDKTLAENASCISAYSPMIWNTTYTVGYFNTFCTIKKGMMGYSIKAKHPDVVNQKECKRIGGFMQCYETLKACHNNNDTACKSKNSYCKDRLAKAKYDPEKDPSNKTSD